MNSKNPLVAAASHAAPLPSAVALLPVVFSQKLMKHISISHVFMNKLFLALIKLGRGLYKKQLFFMKCFLHEIKRIGKLTMLRLGLVLMAWSFTLAIWYCQIQPLGMYLMSSWQSAKRDWCVFNICESIFTYDLRLDKCYDDWLQRYLPSLLWLSPSCGLVVNIMILLLMTSGRFSGLGRLKVRYVILNITVQDEWDCRWYQCSIHHHSQDGTDKWNKLITN